MIYIEYLSNLYAFIQSDSFQEKSKYLQVQQRTIPDTLRILWEQEGVNIFKKGLTARMTSSCIYSVAIIFGYETVKKACVLPEYKERVRW